MNIQYQAMKILLILWVFSSLGHGYALKLAVFKNADGLDTLIDLLESKKDKNNIVIYKNNGLHYAFTSDYTSKNEATVALARYKKVFKDAYVVVETKMNNENTVMVKKVKPDVAEAIEETENDEVLKGYLLEAMNEKESHYGMNDLSKMRLVNQTKSTRWSDQINFHKGIFYIRYLKGSKNVKAKVLKSQFKAQHLTYGNILEKKPALGRAQYKTKNKELIIFDKKQGLMMSHYIKKVNNKYILVSVSMHGKEVNVARYYYNKNDAIGLSK